MCKISSSIFTHTHTHTLKFHRYKANILNTWFSEQTENKTWEISERKHVVNAKKLTLIGSTLWKEGSPVVCFDLKCRWRVMDRRLDKSQFPAGRGDNQKSPNDTDYPSRHQKHYRTLAVQQLVDSYKQFNNNVWICFEVLQPPSQ